MSKKKSSSSNAKTAISKKIPKRFEDISEDEIDKRTVTFLKFGNNTR